MILETDKALLSLLRTEILDGAPVAVAFDAPNRPWIQQVKGLVINLYLYDVRENMQRREVMFTEIRDDNGKLLERRPPPRRYDLYYALTIWAPKVPLEHQVMACVLAGLSEYDTIPTKHLPPELADTGHVVLLSVADGMKRAMLQNLAGELKMSLEVVVTVPIFGKMPLPLGPPVAKPVTLTMNGSEKVAAVGAAGGKPAAAPAPGKAAPNDVRQAQQQAMVNAAKAATQPGVTAGQGPAQPGGAAPGQPGAAAPGQRPAQPGAGGQAAPGQRPGQPGQPGQRPGQPGQPGAAAGRPANPIALAQAALAQAAQSQALLAQAQAALVKVLTAASGQLGAAGAGAQGRSAGQPPTGQPGAAGAGAQAQTAGQPGAKQGQPGAAQGQTLPGGAAPQARATDAPPEGQPGAAGSAPPPDEPAMGSAEPAARKSTPAGPPKDRGAKADSQGGAKESPKGAKTNTEGGGKN